LYEPFDLYERKTPKIMGKDDSSEDNSNGYMSTESVRSEGTSTCTKGRGRRAKDDKNCRVCGDKALGYNFNAVTCE
jgi:hypothetical protein